MSGLSRRELLEAGGLAAVLGSVLAACGASAAEEPGRVGYAPAITAPPQATPNDAAYLRTATSMEYLMVDVYTMISDQGGLDEQASTLIERMVENHRAAADTTAELTTEAGGAPYECANSWYAQRVVPPIFQAVTGDEDEDLAPSDEPADDLLRISCGFETMTSSMYQKLLELVAEPALRTELAALGATAARHAAAVAMQLTGTPDGYISPVVLGGELTPDESGRAQLFAVPERFGSLASTELVVGAPNDAGTRPDFALETPAENAYVYDDQSCET